MRNFRNRLPGENSLNRSFVAKRLRPVSKLNSQVPKSLENIVRKATAKAPADRYRTANESGDGLGQFLAGEFTIVLTGLVV